MSNKPLAIIAILLLITSSILSCSRTKAAEEDGTVEIGWKGPPTLFLPITTSTC